MMKAGSIDLGTNTCLLLIADIDVERRKVQEIIVDESSLVRLGRAVDASGKFTEEGKQATLDCLKRYQRIVEKQGLQPRDIRCVATAGARGAKDAQEFLDEIWDETRFKFEILSGSDEAQLSFNGALLEGMDPAQSAVIDIGGGSTEYMSKMGGLSLDMGAVRFTERYLTSDPVTDDEFWVCRAKIDEELRSVKPWRNFLNDDTRLVAVAGTATNLGSWFLNQDTFDRNRLDQTVLQTGDVHRMVEELKWRSVKERGQLPGIELGRADVILAGALILWRSMELLGFQECHISTRGLRFGILFRH